MDFDLEFENSGNCEVSSPDSLVDQLIRVDKSKVRNHPNDPIFRQSREEIEMELFGPISSCLLYTSDAADE